MSEFPKWTMPEKDFYQLLMLRTGELLSVIPSSDHLMPYVDEDGGGVICIFNREDQAYAIGLASDDFGIVIELQALDASRKSAITHILKDGQVTSVEDSVPQPLSRYGILDNAHMTLTLLQASSSNMDPFQNLGRRELLREAIRQTKSEVFVHPLLQRACGEAISLFP